MPEPDHLALLRAAVPDLVSALTGADPSAPVPACPGWTVTDLAHHLGDTHRWAASIVLSGVRQRKSAAWDHGSDLPRWNGALAAVVLDALAAVDPDEQCWNFAPVEQRAGFWRRRQLHETVVHTVDVRQAGGAATPVDPAVAADGLDEVFEVFLPRLLQRGIAPAVTQPAVFVATDSGDAWTLTPGDDPRVPPVVERAAGAGVVRVTGTAADLYLAAWKRVPADRLTVEGDTKAGVALMAAALTP